ncbi:DUF1552 domain-containing protein [Peristeroidobacter soli]|uniref:DUF1552 domain-containing protein n=1 Tax=Peristeroidobacter soli TaxID=2497877 RepID=UPI00101DEF6C|nr:DUF1552 domain-containing protein [Peristeroidobacter soli]
MSNWSRRRVLRGIVNGGVVSVGLPLLNCFLNDNGTAHADGRPLPVRFGTWFWGCGMSAKVFVPTKFGTNYDLPEEIKAFKPIQQHMNMLTNYTAFLDGNENLCHFSGWVATRAGHAPKSREDRPGETIDITIANQIGRTSRFKTLTATATGEPRTTVSYEGVNSPTMPEYTALHLYQRIFGSEFQDPNAPTFTPSPAVMVRKSVLSGVMDDVKKLNRRVGAEDRARLDQYFTSLRHLEQQFDQQLQRPDPIAACKAPPVIKDDVPAGRDFELVARRHKIMSELMAMAVACDQTRVFNLAYSAPFADTVRAGYEKPHHSATHEEGIDEERGYQPEVSWFTRRAMDGWVELVQAFANVKEGDGTLLDNCFIMGNSDHGLARIHSLDGMAMFTAGRAGGQLKTGLHIDGAGSPTTRLSYTALRLMGVNANSFGSKSNATSKEISEIVA